MRLIDADALIAELQKDEELFDKEAKDAKDAKDDSFYTEGYSDAMWSRANGIRDAIVEVYDAPSINLVHCGECKFEWTQKCPPHRMGLIHDENDYCSYGIGKRIDDE